MNKKSGDKGGTGLRAPTSLFLRKQSLDTALKELGIISMVRTNQKKIMEVIAK
jgi:hypothetical protein